MTETSLNYYQCPKQKCGLIFQDFDDCQHHIRIHWLRKVKIKKHIRPVNLASIDTQMIRMCYLCDCQFKGLIDFEKHQAKQHLPSETKFNNVVSILFE